MEREFWIVPGDENWHWQVMNERDEVMREGIAETMTEACERAREAARQSWTH